jgi:hypothetical protein
MPEAHGHGSLSPNGWMNASAYGKTREEESEMLHFAVRLSETFPVATSWAEFLD